MRNESRQNFNLYLGRVAELNGINVADTNKTFSVTPSVQQKLETAVQESSAFLGKINMIAVDELQGEKLGLSLSGPIASRTNTTNKDRATRDLTDIAARGYYCRQTNYDSHLTYAKIDAWAKFPDFQVRIARMLAQRQALDRMCIGFNGTSIAEDTDIAANPLLQDVNKGWLQKIRDAGGTHFRSGVTVGAGAGANYKNIDELVDNFINTYIHEAYQEREDLVVIPARNLVNHKYTGIWNAAGANTELIAAGQLDRDKYHFANRAIERTSFMPAGTLLVTPVNNLSIYTQKDSSRRTLKDVPEGDRLEAFQSQNVAYVVEDYDACVLVENITFV